MEKVYALLVVLLPILAVYASPLYGFDLGTFLVIAFGVFCLKKRIRIVKNKCLSRIIIYTILLSLVAILLPNVHLYSSISSIIMRTARFVIMLFIMINIGVGTYINYELLIKYLRYVTLVVAIYAIIQLIFFNFTGMKLINVFGPTKQGVVFEALLGKYEEMYRPPSLFLEPSSVTYYVIPYMCYALFHKCDNEHDGRKDLIDSIIISISILCTTSGQGLIVLLGIWCVWFFVAVKQVSIKKTTIGLVFFSAIFLLIRTNSTIQYTVNRLVGNEDGGINAVDARYVGYSAYGELDIMAKVFGTGYGNYNENIYYSSFADILFCTGIVGLVLVLMLYLSLWKSGQLYQKILILASFVLMLGGGIYSATYLCFYLPIIIEKRNNDKLLDSRRYI